MNMHRAFFCRHCEFTAPDSLSITLHMETTHPVDGSHFRKDRYGCQRCKFKTFSPDAMREHANTHS